VGRPTGASPGASISHNRPAEDGGAALTREPERPQLEAGLLLRRLAMQVRAQPERVELHVEEHHLRGRRHKQQSHEWGPAPAPLVAADMLLQGS
jgi:hypothetical protein